MMGSGALPTCTACLDAYDLSLRWAHGDPVHARAVLEAKMVGTHTEESFNLDAFLSRTHETGDRLVLGSMVAYFHLAKFYRALLEQVEGNR